MSACGRIPCVGIGRLQWIALFALGETLDVGAADASTWIHYVQPPPVDRVVLLDCDVWKHKVKFPFVRGDGHRLPFKDGAFDTVVLGDVLEHCVDPVRLLQEAKRVCRFRIVATVPDEDVWKLKHARPDYAPGMWKKAVEDFKKDFHLDYAMFTDVADEDRLPHLRHLRTFTLDSLIQLLAQADMVIYLAYLQHEYPHFGVYLEKGKLNLLKEG